MDTKHIQIRDYDYPLPDERIAKFPLPERDSSKLLVYESGNISETVFRSLPALLPEGSLMVFNNTRVIQARLHFRKGEAQDGALIEIFLLEPADPVEYQENFARKGTCSWYCLVGNLKKWKEGKLTRTLTIDHSTLTITAERIGTHGTSQEIRFTWWTDDAENEQRSMVNGQCSMTFAEVIDAVGELPIPPYLNRKTQESDKTTYQTVYSKIKGSVAAPTAGLHFTKRVLADIDAKGIEREEVTLHVGAGTFRPVKSEDIGGHDMHTEHIAVHRHTIERLLAHGGEAIAVGTTSVRTLESLYYMGVLAASSIPSKGGENCNDTPSPLERVGERLSPLHVPQWMPYEYDGSLSTMDALTALLRYMDERGEEVLHSSTQIIIAPGYKYHIVRRMITNFHQPQSTLLLLVSAFIGEGWRDVYDYALSHDFRFLSYGDSSMLIP
ncbi:MAG: S-adenosylmethionine:tRNA ribosyltransferase-isomerase [Bacteroidaceae bacterium]|nr:S-adenosylmethionine:tRNA ribosyltransferase-isomerase [Bacteroidaceae bacterium]